MSSSAPRCPKHLLEALIAAQGRNMIARDMNASLRVQQRLYDAYRRALDAVARKCPAFDTSSTEFHQRLNDRASAWNRARVVRGPGVDW